MYYLYTALVELLDPATTLGSVCAFYTLVMKLLQFLMLLVICGSFNVYDAVLPLIILCALSIIMVFFLPHSVERRVIFPE